VSGVVDLVKNTRVRKAGCLAVGVVVVAVFLAGRLHPLEARAVAALDRGDQPSVPSVLAGPLWTGVTARTSDASAAMRIIEREQRRGVLRAVLGRRPARVVQLGKLDNGGRTIGATVLLGLPVARRSVRATVPGGRFTARVLRDVLVDVDLRRDAIVDVEPGPASRTSGPVAGPAPAPPISAVSARAAKPVLVRLSRHGPSFARYDGTPAPGAAGRDWPVSLVFAGHATVGKVKRALRTVGFTRLGERRWLAYRGPDGSVRFDSDRGLKTACDANGTDVHLRVYAPPRTDHFSDPRLGEFVVATVHFDRGEDCAPPPQLFGFSEEAERHVADVAARNLGWRVQRDRVALDNAEPYRRDLAAPDHLWWSDGRATLITVP
jgi:hypothetical protein